MKTKNDFTHQLLSLVLPISLQLFMLSLVGVSDAVMLGKLNQDSFVAQFWGKKDMLQV